MKSSKVTWEIVKDLKGLPSHEQGGVDLTLGPRGLTFTHPSGRQVKAEYGLYLSKKDQDKPNIPPRQSITYPPAQKVEIQLPRKKLYPWRKNSPMEEIWRSDMKELPPDLTEDRKNQLAAQIRQQQIEQENRIKYGRDYNVYFNSLNESVRPDKNIRLNDQRSIYPATGQPINPNTDLFTGDYSADVFRSTMSSAKKYGVDPYEMVAIIMQETKGGKLGWDISAGNVIHDHVEDLRKEWPGGWKPELEPQNEYDRIATALYWNNNHAKENWDKFGIVPTEKDIDIWRLQQYNGWGDLKPTSSTTSNAEQKKITKFYHIPVSEENPLVVKKNPVYGKTIVSYRDELKKSKELQILYDEVYNKGLTDFESWHSNYVKSRK